MLRSRHGTVSPSPVPLSDPWLTVNIQETVATTTTASLEQWKTCISRRQGRMQAHVSRRFRLPSVQARFKLRRSRMEMNPFMLVVACACSQMPIELAFAHTIPEARLPDMPLPGMYMSTLPAMHAHNSHHHTDRWPAQGIISL